MRTKFLILLLVIILSLCLTTSCSADIKILNEVGPLIKNSKVSDDELVPDIQNVKNEVDYITNQIPKLNKVNWVIHVGAKRHNKYLGLAYINGEIYLNRYVLGTSRSDEYKEWLTRSVVAHEIGHAVQFTIIPGFYLEEYFKFRNIEIIEIDKLNKDNHFNNKEEIFAEDFRYLFSSSSYLYPLKKSHFYRPDLKPPGNREKQWIINKINERLLIYI